MEVTRKSFLGGSLALFAAGAAAQQKKTIQGFDETNAGKLAEQAWTPFSDRKVRVGIAGEGYCSFGSAFGYQNHPNVEVVACTDLDAGRCKLLQERVKAQKTYSSCEEMIKHAGEDKLDAVYIATDAASMSDTGRTSARNPSEPFRRFARTRRIAQPTAAQRTVDAARPT